jgi:hypothetical protein
MPSLGVRVACHRSHRHRLAYAIRTSADKSFTKANPQGIGKPMPNKAAASRTHFQTWQILKCQTQQFLQRF